MLLSSARNLISYSSSYLGSIASKCGESFESLMDPKRFSIGALASSFITPLGMMTAGLAEKMGLIAQDQDPLESSRLAIERLKQSTGWNISTDTIMNATCKLQERWNQINSNFPDPSDHGSVLAEKVLFSSSAIFTVPFVEEFFFREFLQGFIFKKASNFVIKNCVSQVKSPIIEKIDKLVRVVLTASLFSLSHLNNKDRASDAQLQGQLVYTFVLGLGLGLLKESDAGLAGAVGAHMANNAIAAMEYLMSC